MKTFLFDQIIFGPVKSRRLGVSLGINLLPNNAKICNFNCIYCECGWTMCSTPNKMIHSRKKVKEMLHEKLLMMKANNEPIDVITFAGNGEPTLHPDFDKIIDDTILLKEEIFPNVKIAVLSNATLIYKKRVFNALSKIEQNILKMDSSFESTIKVLNNPTGKFSLSGLVENLKKFKGNLVIQTLFVKGIYKGQTVNNATPEEVEGWLNVIREIKPKGVMIYTIERDTPASGLKKILLPELKNIAEKVEKLGIKTQVSG